MKLEQKVKHAKIPPTTVARLPLYLRCLRNIQGKNVDSISSSELAKLTGHNAAQLRKDLSYLGEFGTRGVGYDVDELIGQIGKWLGTTSVRQFVIVGAGHLGQALCSYKGFINKGFQVAGLYDADPAKIGKRVGDLEIRHIDDLGPQKLAGDIEIGIIATPADVAQTTADMLVQAGVKSILNFAPAALKVDKCVCIRNVDLATELQIIGFHLAGLEHGLISDCCN